MVAALLGVVPKARQGCPSRGWSSVRPHLPADVCTSGVSVSWSLSAVKLDLDARGALLGPTGSPRRLLRARCRAVALGWAALRTS